MTIYIDKILSRNGVHQKVWGNLNQIFYLSILDCQLNGYFSILEAQLIFVLHFLMHSLRLTPYSDLPKRDDWTIS